MEWPGDGLDGEEIRYLGMDLRNLKKGYLRTDRLDDSDALEEEDVYLNDIPVPRTLLRS